MPCPADAGSSPSICRSGAMRGVYHRAGQRPDPVAYCALRLRRCLSPGIENRNARLLKIAGIARNYRQAMMKRRRGDDEIGLRISMPHLASVGDPFDTEADFRKRDGADEEQIKRPGRDETDDLGFRPCTPQLGENIRVE